MSNTSPAALQPGYELHWYRIERVLGQGAFGITYLAHDVNLDRQVAIKEYLPGQFSVRDSNLTVRPTHAQTREDFDWGLKRFISEARTLTKFEHPNLVRVFNVFEMNNTAYMVMNYEVGKSLQEVLKNRKTLSESELMKIILPLMSGVELMHSKGFVHRDIKPGNIFIRGDGSPVLLDFGSARQTRAASADRNKSTGDEPTTTLTTLVSPGYAPIEQYGSKSDRQGPWTDIYGLGATLFRALTGVMPVAAVDRSEAIINDQKDPYPVLITAYAGKCSESFLKAIDHAMAFKAQDRPQSIEEWRKEFAGAEIITDKLLRPDAERDSSEVITQKLEEKTAKLYPVSNAAAQKPDSEAATEAHTGKSLLSRLSGFTGILIGATAVVIIVLVISLFSGGDKNEAPPAAPETVAQTPEVSPPVMTEPETPATAPQTEEPATASVTEATNVDATQQAKIDYLLGLADEDMKALRLTSPKDNNAFDKYLSVLELDSNNTAAQDGIQAISDKYVGMAHKAMNANNFDQAENYLNKAGAISPNSRKLADAQAALKTKRDEYEAATTAGTAPPAPAVTETAPATTTAATEKSSEADDKSFWDKVKDWNEEQERISKENPKKESEVDKRVKDAFK